MMKRLIAAVALFCAVPLFSANLILAGDSTIADYTQSSYRPRYGWGEALPALCKDDVKVFNFGIPGASTRTFIKEKKGWNAVVKATKPGDFVFIQFGHNDASHWGNDRVYTSVEDFEKNLALMIADVRRKNATPVLLTITTCFQNTEKQTANHNAYNGATRRVAADTKTELIDLCPAMEKQLSAMDEESQRTCYMVLKSGEHKKYPDGLNDRVHLSRKGADFVARLAVTEAKTENLSCTALFK